MAKTGQNFRPNKGRKLVVWALTVAGIPQPEIAAHLGIDPKTLRKHFPEQLSQGKNLMIAKSVGVLMYHLGKNDRTTAMFCLKALAGWRDQGPTEQQANWNLEELERQIAFLERSLGVKPGESPPDPEGAGTKSP